VADARVPRARAEAREGREGGDAWLYKTAARRRRSGRHRTRGRPREELRWSGARYATMNQGNSAARSAVDEMLEDGRGRRGDLLPQRTMRHFMLGTETTHLAGIRAYNDCSRRTSREGARAPVASADAEVAGRHAITRCAR